MNEMKAIAAEMVEYFRDPCEKRVSERRWKKKISNEEQKKKETWIGHVETPAGKRDVQRLQQQKNNQRLCKNVLAKDERRKLKRADKIEKSITKWFL